MTADVSAAVGGEALKLLHILFDHDVTALRVRAIATDAPNLGPTDVHAPALRTTAHAHQRRMPITASQRLRRGTASVTVSVTASVTT